MKVKRNACYQVQDHRGGASRCMKAGLQQLSVETQPLPLGVGGS